MCTIELLLTFSGLFPPPPLPPPLLPPPPQPPPPPGHLTPLKIKINLKNAFILKFLFV